ncbi:MAG: sugar phosphate nucleotidyltransferase [Patescibacteria group bacterium]
MKGVILAGGKGTRLLPFTKFTNKHLLPIGRKPMILYPLETLKRSGIRKVLIVADGKFLSQFKTLLGSGKSLGMQISFVVQRQASGIAGALRLAEEFAGNDDIAVVLGDNIFEDNFASAVKSFQSGARVFLKRVPDPERFGVAELRGSRVHRIIEKPKYPKSDLAVVGLYFYDANVFDAIRGQKPSRRGELEITDVNNWYQQKDQLDARKVKGFWSDAGTLASLARATELVRGLNKNT